jgi:DNA replication protein DnaC
LTLLAPVVGRGAAHLLGRLLHGLRLWPHVASEAGRIIRTGGRSSRIFTELELAHGDGRFPRLFSSLVKVDLLILDDWGPDRLNPGQRRDLMEIVEDRSGARSTLVTSQLPVDAWHAVIDEPTVADAILDRLVHDAFRLGLDGPSMRKLKAGDDPAKTRS